MKWRGASRDPNDAQVDWEGPKFHVNATYCSCYNCFLCYGYLKGKGMIYVCRKTIENIILNEEPAYIEFIDIT